MLKISPTQIAKWRQCQRAFVYEYVYGHKSPPSPKQEFGIQGHAVLADYLKCGTEIPDTIVGRVARQGVEFLPAPGAHLLVEHEISFPLDASIEVAGYTDLAVPGDVPIIFDHKFTGQDLRWAKTAAQLFEDPQVVIYSLWAMLHFNVPRVRQRWIYYCSRTTDRRPMGAHPIDLEITNDDPAFLANVEVIEKDARRIAEIRAPGKKVFALDMPPNFSACSAYGGCPHAGRCDLKPKDVIDTIFNPQKI